MKDSQDSEGGTLDEMPDNREKELVETTSSTKTGHQVEKWDCYSIVKISDREVFLPKSIIGTKTEKSLRERR